MVVYLLATVIIDVVHVVPTDVMLRSVGPLLWHASAKLALYVMLQRDARQKAQAWLMQNFGAVGDSAAAAAAIAGLLGASTPRDALAQASSRFRSVNLATLSFEDFRSSPLDDAPRDLYAQTEAVLHGNCDAFITHSWHDSPELKWAALQRWRSEFLTKHGREPKVWLDKCCIDQENIETDLRCLPIFLSGCKELIVLCGMTYVTRLWCVMELFTFAYMKGDLDQVVLIELASERQAQNDPAFITNALEAFDVQDCMCSQPEDKERMLAIIFAAFRDAHCFNEKIRRLMREVELRKE